MINGSFQVFSLLLLIHVLTQLYLFQYRINSVAWSPNGTKLASGTDDKSVKIWSMDSNGTFKSQPSTLTGHKYFLPIQFKSRPSHFTKFAI